MNDKLTGDLALFKKTPYPQLVPQTIRAAIQRIEKARSLEEVTPILVWSQAARTLAKQVRMGLEIVNLAAETRLRSERKLGKFLLDMNLRGGDRKSKSRCTVTLEDMQISRDESKRWQKLASISDEVFDAFVKSQNDAGREITQAAALRVAKRSNEFVKDGKRDSSITANLIIGKPKRPNLANSISKNRTLPPSPTSDALSEVMNHFAMINEMCLNPLCEKGSHEIDKSKQRILTRYVREIIEFFELIRNEERAKSGE